MDFKTLFFSYEGRSGRKAFWIGIVPIYVLIIAASIFGGDVGGAVMGLAMAYPGICVVAKRLHDLGYSGWWQVLPNAVSNIASRVGIAIMSPTNSQGDSALIVGGSLLIIASLLLAAGWVIFLGSVRGQDRKNDYGHPPGQRDVVEVF